jgi:hypothetical protein
MSRRNIQIVFLLLLQSILLIENCQNKITNINERILEEGGGEKKEESGEEDGEKKESADSLVEQINPGEKEDMAKNLEKFLLEQELIDIKEKEAHLARPESTCNTELIHSYRLFPRKDITNDQRNFICPYITKENDCCEFNSQNMIQVLWGRISKPRLEREMTFHLSAIESILNDMKSIMHLFMQGQLPQHTEYSAECLDAVNEMDILNKDNFEENLDNMYILIKLGFERIFKFKKTFYCFICNKQNHEYINVFDKQIILSHDFCLNLAADYKDLVYFLNFQLIKQFQTIRNFTLCYREKNYLLVKDVYKFKFDKTEMRIINKCMFDSDCLEFCEKFKPSDLSEFFIGKKEWLQEMRHFLEVNKVTNGGFLEEVESKEDLPEEQLKEVEVEEEMKKMEFFQPENRTIDEVQWDFWREMFDISKRKMTQKKMASIKRKMKREFDEEMLYQFFINANKAKINLDRFDMKPERYGINLYEFLEKEDLYKVNAQLSFFAKPLDNTVGELLNLDETSILEHMITVSKYIKDNEQPEDMVKYIESKIFKNEAKEVFNMIQDPYIKTINVNILLISSALLLQLLIFM